jgi:hypothetical protein
MARASTLSAVCVYPNGERKVPQYPCFDKDHEHEPNPQWWITEDGYEFKVGDRVFNYYDCWWGIVEDEPRMPDGWFHLRKEGSEGRGSSYNSVRISKFPPSWYDGPNREKNTQ